MTDTSPRDLIKLLIDALKEECNWIDNPKHDELIAKATAYLTQYEPEVATDEELNSKSSPNNLQIRSSELAAQYGADQELEACIDWISVYTGLEHPELLIELLRAARRPKPPRLKEQSLKHLEVMERDGYYLPEILQDLRRALEALPE